MNLVDFILIGTLATGGLLGLWIGMVRASFSVLGVLAVFVVVGQWQGGVSLWLGAYVASQQLAEVMSYAFIIAGSVAATIVAARVARKLVYGMFMGWADRLAGMTAGLAVGAAMAGAMMVAIAGFSYSEDVLNKGVAGKIIERTPLDSSEVEAKIGHSKLVSILVSAADIIPDKAYDILPENWQDALDDLEQRLDTARG
ncbi:MAG: hypothetical protein CL732_00850 [Chloroflexi bacterium]|nr:hypothetical protein [Chloroflexota bacterium]